jgi:hypothetical protein
MKNAEHSGVEQVYYSELLMLLNPQTMRHQRKRQP